MKKIIISTLVLNCIFAIALTKSSHSAYFPPECPQMEGDVCIPWKRWQSTPIFYQVCEDRLGGARFAVKNTGNRKISFTYDLTFKNNTTDKGNGTTLNPGQEESATCPRCPRKKTGGVRSVRMYNIKYTNSSR